MTTLSSSLQGLYHRSWISGSFYPTLVVVWALCCGCDSTFISAAAARPSSRFRVKIVFDMEKSKQNESTTNSINMETNAIVSSSESTGHRLAFSPAATGSPLQRQPSTRDVINVYSTVVAGAGSGALASVLCAPLDLIRTRLQVWGDVTGKKGDMSVVPHMLREIVRTEGWKGCLRGLGATLVTVPVFWGVYCTFVSWQL
jgi:hypothetical protein